MSNPREKAIELYSKYCSFASFWMDQNDAKKCALICVEELINYSKEWDDDDYWQAVKREIIKR
jgi:hypothetical protein